ncbi:MAG: SAM-dependent methyltransferase [Nitrolancea sp.]
MSQQDARTASNPELVDELRAILEREGRITFAHFMRDALYHPEHGYYLNAAARPGPSGDFLTAPEADPIFGQTLTRQIAQFDELLGRPDPFTLVEYGAGSGTLALAILDALSLDCPALLERFRYQPVEINEARAAELRGRLEEAGYGEHLSMMNEKPVEGCVLANEFLDALPVHRIERKNGKIRERYVVWRDGWFAEEPGPLSIEELARYLKEGDIELVDGQLAEINLGLSDWVAQVVGRLRRGYVLAIDYGYPAEKLYGPDYPQGTLRTYAQHAVGGDPFSAVGKQDLTAHVDFSALQRAAREQGLQLLGFTTQADFLGGTGIGELLVRTQQEPGMSYQEYVGVRSAVIRMIDPGAMGRFGVLILGRDVPASPLIGLSASF